MLKLGMQLCSYQFPSMLAIMVVKCHDSKLLNPLEAAFSYQPPILLKRSFCVCYTEVHHKTFMTETLILPLSS